MSTKPKKKNRKLLIQIGHILVPLFFFMFIATVYSMFDSTLNGFLEAQDSHMAYLLELMDSRIVWFNEDELGWYLEKWEEDPLAAREEPTAAERSVYLDSLTDDAWSYEWLNSIPDEAKRYCCKTQYDIMKDSISFDPGEKTYDKVMLIDLDEEHLGMVISEFSRDTSPKQMGDYYTIDLAKHSAIKSMLETNSPKTVFEKSYDIPGRGAYYIGYKPLLVDGKVRAALAIVYKWNDFRHNMLLTLRKTAAVSVAGMLIAMVILFLMLYRKAVSPVRTIQQSVREYIETKDSEAVIAGMSKIKERNEFGLHADNISELVREIDRYTEENIKLTGERERVAAELDMARNIQAEQLPGRFPAFPDRDEFEIYATMTPAKEVGGDFYDFFLVDDDHLALVIADVSGKGVPAALFMMMSKILINNFTMMGLSPAEVLTRMNDTVCKNNKQNMFVTVWLGILEISTGKVTAANAGHEYPVIR